MSSEHQRGAEPVRSSSDESKLAELRGHEERLEALRARRTDLEVERIAAEVALRATRAGPGPDVPGAHADAVVTALDRLRRLESRHCAQRAYTDAGVRSQEELIERLHAGDDALGAWLEAGRASEGAAGRRIARRALLVACLAILALAFAVHLAFLVLLVPVGGTMSFLLWTGQDREWRRTGARRRFDRLRLEAPSAWTEDAVRERRRALARIAAQVRERASTPAGDAGDAEQEDGHAPISTPPARTCMMRSQQQVSTRSDSTNPPRQRCVRLPASIAPGRRCTASWRRWRANGTGRARSANRCTAASPGKAKGRTGWRRERRGAGDGDGAASPPVNDARPGPRYQVATAAPKVDVTSPAGAVSGFSAAWMLQHRRRKRMWPPGPRNGSGGIDRR